MITYFECFSTELLFEIFEYLSPYDLFRSFINLNDRFTNIIHSYPLHLNFRSISRLKFDYICFHFQPKQVISLILSDENIPNEIEIFLEYFPFFQQEFNYLKSLTLIQIFPEQIDLPKSIQSLEIRKYDIYQNFPFNLDQLLEQQSNILTHLKIDRIGLLNSINKQLPALTHLTIDGGFHPTECNDQYKTIIDMNTIFQRIGINTLTYLHLFIDKENEKIKLNLQQFSHCLTHFTLHFVEDIIVSYQTLEEYLNNLHQLTHLTLQACGKNDLIDGNQWEIYLVKTNIIKFNFKFRISNIYLNGNQSIILQSFRSSFWLEDKQWYVGYFINTIFEETYLFTIPKFRIINVIYPSSDFLYRTTAPINIERKIIYEYKINCLEIKIHKFPFESPIHRFTKVKSLILSGLKLLPLNQLETIIDLNQIEELDLCDIKYLSKYEFYKLIKYLPRLYSITMQCHPLFIIPLQIHTLRLKTTISINNLCRMMPYVKTLEIPINSKYMMINIIDQMKSVENFLFICDDFSQDYHYEFFHGNLHIHWLEENSDRLGRNYFTLRQGEEYQQIHISIGGRKN